MKRDEDVDTPAEDSAAPAEQAGAQELDATELLRDVVVAGLRNAIMNGRMQPGERIRQERVAKEYQTSRIPVREALQQLQAEGFVTLERNIGARVATLDLVDLDELYRIRESLEPLAMLQSVPALTDADLAELEAKQRDMINAAERGDPSAWIQRDREFHFLAMSRSPLERLKGMIDGLWNISAQYRRVYALTPEKLQIAHSEHDLMIEAMRRRDASAASDLCRYHIRRTRLSVTADRQLAQGQKEVSRRRRSRRRGDGNSTEQK